MPYRYLFEKPLCQVLRLRPELAATSPRQSTPIFPQRIAAAHGRLLTAQWSLATQLVVFGAVRRRRAQVALPAHLDLVRPDLKERWSEAPGLRKIGPNVANSESLVIGTTFF